GWRRRLPGAAGVEADAAGSTGHLSRDGVVGPGAGRPGQPPAGRLRAAPAVAGRVAIDARRTRTRPLARGRPEAVVAAPAAGAATGRPVAVPRRNLPPGRGVRAGRRPSRRLRAHESRGAHRL